MKHTPGPWRGYKDEGVYVGDGFEHPIFETGCGCCTETTLTEADARLIAAAPDLLEALRQAVDSTPKRYTDQFNAQGDRIAAHPLWVSMARAAIRKAVGDE
jgi:hypothetical protein